MNYLINVIKPSIISPLFYQMNSVEFAMIALYFVFLLQVVLLIYILIATLLTQYWINSALRRLILERRIDIINSILHWYFTFYPVFFILMASLTLAALSCGNLGLFSSVENNCNQLSVIIPAYFTLVLSYIQGIVLIYLLRNHRFNENNSFKRRFAILQLINFTVQFIIIVFHYQNQFPMSDSIKYTLAVSYSVLQICDQFYSCPYRDPFRSPSLQLALILQWVTIISMIFKFSNGLITDEQLFYWLLLPIILFCAFSDVIATLFHEYAMVNYNSKTSLSEKYIILGVDQLYQYYLVFSKNDQSKIKFYQQVVNHNQNCSYSKCPSQRNRLQLINPNDKNQLNKMMIQLTQCIFKQALARVIIKNGKKIQPNFEQLQLQYISFLADIAARPLIGYLELRKYQSNITRNPSIYFRELVSKVSFRKLLININKLSTELESQITDLQYRMVKSTQQIIDATQRISEFSLSQQQKTIFLYQHFIPKFIQCIEKKIRHWELLIEGYQDLRPLQKEQFSLCREIDLLTKEVQQKINIPEWFFDKSAEVAKAAKLKQLSDEEQNINVLNLRLYSILFCCIVNDLDRALFTEKYIRELIKDDRQKQVDIIDDQSLLQDDTVIILVSMVKEKGKIINNNLLTLSNFFEYDNVADIKNRREISKYLPADLQLMHDQLMDNFLQRGYSKYFIRKVHSFYVQKDGFLKECFVKLGNLFSEGNDYVITASLLKLQNQEDVLLFDGEGKIIGITQRFFDDIFKKTNPFMTVSQLTKDGYIFTFFPQILAMLRFYSGNIDMGEEIITDLIDFLYVSDEVNDMSTEFSLIHKINQQENKALSSYNFLNSFRTKNSNNRIQTYDNELAQRLMKLEVDKDGSLQDSIIPMMNKEKINIYLDFLQTYIENHQNLNFILIKLKYSISFRLIKTSKIDYPYFEMRLENLSQYDQQLSISNKSLPFSTVIKKVRNLVNTGKTFSNFSQLDNSKFRTSNNTERDERNRNEDLAFPEQVPSEQMVEQKQLLTQEEEEKQQIIVIDKDKVKSDLKENNIDITQELQLSQLDIPSRNEKAIFFNPVVQIDLLKMDESDIQLLNDEFLNLDKKPLDEKKKIFEDEHEDDENVEAIIEDIDENNAKSSSVKQSKKKGKDLLDVLKFNRENQHIQHDEDLNQKQSSKASSSKTESSKSPFLLIRSMYQINIFQGNILWLALINGLVLLTVFFILFFEISIVQDKYTILQTNLNYVQYPETMNYYFMKISMLGWSLLEEDLGIMDYSDFINKQFQVELNEVRETVDSKLMQIYQDIITYEKNVITEDIPFQIVNNLNSYQTKLDLTLLIEQFTSNTLGFVQSYDDNKNASKKIFTSKMISNLLFFRLNLPAVNEFAKSYINFLNQNLIYYEDEIVNSLTFLIIGEIAFITLLVIIQTKIWFELHDYFEKILVLTTRLSQEEAVEIIESLKQCKAILEEPSQKTWKTTSFIDIIFDKRTLRKNQVKNTAQQSSVDQLQQQHQSSIAYSQFGKLQKHKRTFQNSSLSYRVYNLILPQRSNFILTFILWFFIIGFLLGAIIMAVEQIQSIKPSINLNLQLVEFKLQFDTVVTLGEILKTDGLVEVELEKRTSLQNINFDNQNIVSQFKESIKNFQSQMSTIYNQLTSSKSLLDKQKLELQIPFQTNLCNFMWDEIPFCQIQMTIEESTNLQDYPANFTSYYGRPFPQDNNYEYVSGGIINMVHEFMKTIRIYFDRETMGNLNDNLSESERNKEEIILFLNSSAHVSQFTQHYLDQGKILNTIAYKMLNYNSQTLTDVMRLFQLYNYLGGLGILAFLTTFLILWMKKIKYKLHLSKLSLILIPSENLIEPKTVSALKKLQFI